VADGEYTWGGDVRIGYLSSRSSLVLPHTNHQHLKEALTTNTLSPYWQESVLQFWCQDPPKEVVYELIQGEYPIAAQVLGLNTLSCQPSVEDLPALWKVFIEARFGIRAEDPDLFARSLRLIVEIDQQNPNANSQLMESYIPDLFRQAVQYRDGESLDSKTISTLLQTYYQQYQTAGLYAFSSEGGSLFQSLIDTAKSSNPTVPPLPTHQPGQHPNHAPPTFHQATITKYDATFQPPILFWSFGFWLLSFLLYRYRFTRLSAILMSLGLIIGFEGGLELLHFPTLAAQQPLFSFIDFAYDPYTKIDRQDTQWWISNGGPARWQEIPQHHDIFRIAVLGASSAHGSNLLQEESFSAILEQQLQEQFPKKPIQVINMGIGGTLSNGILSSGNQAIDMGADAIIIYYGHNEVSQFQQAHQLGASKHLATRLWFSHLRSYALLKNILPAQISAHQQSPSPPSKADINPQEIIDWAAQNHYQNLSLILEKCQQKNVPVLQITPAYNFRFASFQAYQSEDNPQATALLEKSKSLRVYTPQKALIEAQKAQKQSHWGSDIALKSLELQAHLHAELGEKEHARLRYQQLFDQAQEITTIHGRIRQNIIDLAQKFGTAHLNAEEVFYHNSNDGITANSLFWDELHPSQKGHQFLAAAIIPWAQEQTSNFLDSDPSH